MLHFKLNEFRCKCGCGEVTITADLTYRIDAARAIAGVPFIINSGYRCAKHNKAIGGSPRSSHLLGEAVDIKVEDSHARSAILTGLREAGFNRIGIDKEFIHADVTKDKVQDVTWLY